MPLVLSLGCPQQPEQPDQPASHAPRAVEPLSGEADYSGYALARHPEAAQLVLPGSSHPEGAPAPRLLPLYEPFRLLESAQTADVYATALPVAVHHLKARIGGADPVGSYQPAGLELLDAVRSPLRYARHPAEPGSWGFDEQRLWVAVEKGATPPRADEHRLVCEQATATEEGLNFDSAQRSETAFAFRTVTEGATSRHGLFLPAPASASWSLRLPEAAVLVLDGTVLRPAVPVRQGSDGAELAVFVESEGQAVEVGRAALQPGSWSPLRFDLSAWAGRDVVLRLQSLAGGDACYDYVFLHEPSVYTPSPNPKRLVLLFVDTLRHDHLSFYGYERDTTPALTEVFSDSLVADGLRTVSPWTLPAVRSLLTGEQPEAWFDAPNLPERLARAGFYSHAIVTNAYLTTVFDMQRGWSGHTYEVLLPAEQLVDEALEVLERHRDRDLLLMVHFMDPHLPYQEPEGFQGLYAGPAPQGLEQVNRSSLARHDPRQEGFEEAVRYVRDRYDQNIRYVDEHAARLVRGAGDDATVALFSDHGEEFWEHGAFEHGHSFYDEVLRVPLLLRDPHLPAGGVSLHGSLMDLAPTLLELLELDSPQGTGRSLVPAMLGDQASLAALAERPQVFGRPLYDGDGWSVLLQDRKWITRDGRERLYDLGEDPQERKDIASGADLGPYPLAMAGQLGRPVHSAWRIFSNTQAAQEEVVMTLQAEPPIEACWSAYDPRGLHDGLECRVEQGRAVLVQEPGQRLPPTIYARVQGDPRAAELTVALQGDGSALQARHAGQPVPRKASPQRILTAVDSRRGFQVDFTWVPEPTGAEVPGYDERVEEELRALGYVD